MDTKQTIRLIVADQLGIEHEDLKDDADLINDIGVDSLDIIEIIVAIETKFDINLNQDLWLTAMTISQMADLVDKHHG